MPGMMTPHEERDHQRALTHLPHAQTRRLERVELLRAVRARETDPVPLVLDPPDCLRTMFVFDFLRQLPRMGSARIRDLNRVAVREQVNLAVNLGDLSPGQAQWLAVKLRRPPLAGRPQG